jgi:glycosyltransferase involved in cell wall biosynthesis
MPSADRRRSLAIVSAVPVSLNAFMAPHVRQLSRKYAVTLIADGRAADVERQLSAQVTFAPVAIRRAISPVADLRALAALWRLFRAQQIDIVQSITPKAGLLSMVAARLAGVPIRVHWFTGQVWATRSGARRWLLKSLDRLLAACATDVLADSPSQRDFLVREGVVSPQRIVVLAAGSVCGVDTGRFQPDPEARREVRDTLGIPGAAVVYLYLGRLNRDKGVIEVAKAFAACSAGFPERILLVVGPDEGGLAAEMEGHLGATVAQTRFVDFTRTPERFMAASDVFVMPSYREGFGSSVIEAAACGVPALGTDIYGLRDAIVDGVSGMLVPPRDVPALSAAMRRMATDSLWRATLGRQARIRVEQAFSQERLTSALTEFYAGLTPANERRA